jgi:hypothetical protein
MAASSSHMLVQVRSRLCSAAVGTKCGGAVFTDVIVAQTQLCSDESAVR